MILYLSYDQFVWRGMSHPCFLQMSFVTLLLVDFTDSRMGQKAQEIIFIIILKMLMFMVLMYIASLITTKMPTTLHQCPYFPTVC